MPRPRSEVARSKMLDAARDLLLGCGVNAFSIDEVARRSGVAKTTIYRHFPNRIDLLAAALDGSMPVPPVPDTGSLRDDLLEFLASVLPIFVDPRPRAMLLDILAGSARDPELLEVQRSVLGSRAGATLTIFKRAQERGEISPDLDYETALEIMEGPFIIRSLFRPEALIDVDLEAMVDRMLPQLLR